MNVQMISPTSPAITVRSGGWQRTFAPGHEIVVGRDVHADVRILHPGISRSHLILRHLDGDWIAVDDNSSNGIFVDGHRVNPSKSATSGPSTSATPTVPC